MRLARYFTFIIYIFCLACGGGTGGTGDISGPDTRFYGTVTSVNGEVIGNAEVTVADSGDSVYTDQNGNFDIITKLADNKPQLLVRKNDLEQIIDIGELSSLDSEVKISIVVDTPNNSINLKSIEISVRDLNEDAQISPDPGNLTSGSSSSVGNLADPKVVLSVFKGSVTFEDGEPVDGAQVVLQPQNIKTKTNRNGKFRFEAEISASNNLLYVQYKSSSGRISLGNLSANKSLVVNMKLVVKRPLEVGEVDVSNGGPEVVLSELVISQ